MSSSYIGQYTISLTPPPFHNTSIFHPHPPLPLCLFSFLFYSQFPLFPSSPFIFFPSAISRHFLPLIDIFHYMHSCTCVHIYVSQRLAVVITYYVHGCQICPAAATKLYLYVFRSEFCFCSFCQDVHNLYAEVSSFVAVFGFLYLRCLAAISILSVY